MMAYFAEMRWTDDERRDGDGGENDRGGVGALRKISKEDYEGIVDHGVAPPSLPPPQQYRLSRSRHWAVPLGFTLFGLLVEALVRR
mmetsp:Transcript_64829/g.76748  ORF Transcript_64829/g.76748 Transcript_64829/m.76748 type:complete len:86 (-) Transcript_64829:185-442(-)